MSITLVPMDFTKMTTVQQNNAFVIWCGLVMKAIRELNHKAVLKFPFAGDSGMATERVIQKADVWVDPYKVNVVLNFNSMLETDVPNQSRPTEKRNFPSVMAAALIQNAKDWDKTPPPADTYGILLRPTSGDIEV